MLVSIIIQEKAKLEAASLNKGQYCSNTMIDLMTWQVFRIIGNTGNHHKKNVLNRLLTLIHILRTHGIQIGTRKEVTVYKARCRKESARGK